MRWLKRDRWKAGIAIAGMLLLLVLMVWVPISVAGAYEGASGLPTPTTGTVQASPTIDPTIVAATAKEQLRKLERDNDRSFNAWLWNSSAALGTIGAALLAVAGVLATVLFNAKKERTDRIEAQDKDLKDKAEERFMTAVTALGDEKEGTQVGGAILLRSFLHEVDKKIYGRYYTQIFDLTVAYLRLLKTSHPPKGPDGIPHSAEAPNAPPSPTLPSQEVPGGKAEKEKIAPLSQALVMVFKEAFPLAKSQVMSRERQGAVFEPQSLDATGIQLDNAHIVDAHLEEVWMPGASLQKANLIGTWLNGANLTEADLSEASLLHTHLSGARLRGATLIGVDLGAADLTNAKLEDARLNNANLSGTPLARSTGPLSVSRPKYTGDLRRTHYDNKTREWTVKPTDLRGADLRGADFRNADLSESNPEAASNLLGTDLRGVKGLTKEQLEACRSKYAIIGVVTTLLPQ